MKGMLVLGGSLTSGIWNSEYRRDELQPGIEEVELVCGQIISYLRQWWSHLYAQSCQRS